jgi:hypothetical protein
MSTSKVITENYVSAVRYASLVVVFTMLSVVSIVTGPAIIFFTGHEFETRSSLGWYFVSTALSPSNLTLTASECGTCASVGAF